MALELALQVKVDGAQQAQTDLRGVDSAVKGVEDAVRSNTATWQKNEQAIKSAGTATRLTAQEVAELSKQLKENGNNLQAVTLGHSQVEAAAKRMGSQFQQTSVFSELVSGSLQVQTRSIESLIARMSDIGSQNSILLRAFGSLGEYMGMSTAAAVGMTAGLGVLLGALMAVGRVMEDSAEYYVKNATDAKALRTEIDSLTETWHSFEYIVGQAIVQPEQSPIITLLRLGQEWAVKFGVEIAADIELLEKIANVVTLGGVNRVKADMEARDPGPPISLSQMATLLGGVHPPGSLLTDPYSGSYQPLSGSTAEAEFNKQQEELKKQAAAAERLRKAQERLAQQIEDLVQKGVPYAWGLNGEMPGQAVDLAKAGFEYQTVPHLGYQLGVSSSDLGNTQHFTGEDLLKQMGLTQSFGGMLADSLAKSGGSLLEHLIGSKANGLGGDIGGTLGAGLIQGGTGKAITSGLSDMFGKTIGTALSSFIPGVGAIVGSLIGKLFGPTQYQQDARAANANITSMWSALNQQYGGTGADAALKIFGMNPSDLHGKNYQGAMGVQPLTDAFGQLQTKQDTFNTSLGGTLGSIGGLGGNIGPDLLPYLQQLKDAKVLTQDNLDLIAKMGGDAKPTFQQLSDIAQKYNLTIDEMGPSFQKQKLDDSFQKLIDDMDTLTRGGVDVGAALTTMGTDGSTQLTGLGQNVEDLVQQSQKFGYDIPANMKPWIQKLIDSKQLIGDNGQAITDLDQLNFGETMQTTLDNLNQTLKDLISALNVGIPDATKRAATAWKDNLGDLPTPGAGSGGRSGDSSSSGGGGGSTASDGQPVVIQIDGREVARAIVPQIPGVVTQAGLTR